MKTNANSGCLVLALAIVGAILLFPFVPRRFPHRPDYGLLARYLEPMARKGWFEYDKELPLEHVADVVMRNGGSASETKQVAVVQRHFRTVRFRRMQDGTLIIYLRKKSGEVVRIRRPI